MTTVETDVAEEAEQGTLFNAPIAAVEATIEESAPRGCPFLIAESGGWRLDMPSRDHRCAAVSPPAALSVEKQSRLCLTDTHLSCATYLASMSARGARLGTPLTDRATRWGLARTTTVIEDAGGLRSRLTGLVLDRRRWPAIPAVLLVGTLVVLAASGFRGGSAATASPSPSRPAPTAAPTTRPTATPVVTAAPAPSAAPTAAPIVTPAPTRAPVPFRSYTVRSGDTLSLIASRFGTTPKAIAQLSGITVGSTLHVGQVLKIPL